MKTKSKTIAHHKRFNSHKPHPAQRNPKRSKSTSKDSKLEGMARSTTGVAVEDPQDGVVNKNPGMFTPESYPKAEHVVSPHLRKFVHEMDETPQKAIRAPISPEMLVPGYRYCLRHLKHISDNNRSIQLKAQFRGDFDMLRAQSDIYKAEVAFDRIMPNLWSQLSVLRMNISKLRRPRIPSSIEKATEYLGAQEGSGWFCAVPNNDDRFNKDLKSTVVMSSKSDQFQQKAKLYNMDLHPADIARHHELIERFHFNGKDRYR